VVSVQARFRGNNVRSGHLSMSCIRNGTDCTQDHTMRIVRTLAAAAANDDATALKRMALGQEDRASHGMMQDGAAPPQVTRPQVADSGGKDGAGGFCPGYCETCRDQVFSPHGMVYVMGMNDTLTKLNRKSCCTRSRRLCMRCIGLKPGEDICLWRGACVRVCYTRLLSAYWLSVCHLLPPSVTRPP
jgi:hypothetical protein